MYMTKLVLRNTRFRTVCRTLYDLFDSPRVVFYDPKYPTGKYMSATKVDSSLRQLRNMLDTQPGFLYVKQLMRTSKGGYDEVTVRYEFYDEHLPIVASKLRQHKIATITNPRPEIGNLFLHW